MFVSLCDKMNNIKVNGTGEFNLNEFNFFFQIVDQCLNFFVVVDNWMVFKKEDYIFDSLNLIAIKDKKEKKQYFLLSLLNCVPKNDEGEKTWTKHVLDGIKEVMSQYQTVLINIVEKSIFFGKYVHFGHILLKENDNSTDQAKSLAEILTEKNYAEDPRIIDPNYNHVNYFKNAISEEQLTDFCSKIENTIHDEYIPHTLTFSQSMLNAINEFLQTTHSIQVPLENWRKRKQSDNGQRDSHRFVYSHIQRNLPIDSKKADILQAYNQNQIILISGATGSGKTTQIPQYITEILSTEDKPFHIVCTQPRRLAAKSIAHRIAEEMKFELGEQVGYQMRNDTKKTSMTNVVVSTWYGTLMKLIKFNIYISTYIYLFF